MPLKCVQPGMLVPLENNSFPVLESNAYSTALPVCCAARSLELNNPPSGFHCLLNSPVETA